MYVYERKTDRYKYIAILVGLINLVTCNDWLSSLIIFCVEVVILLFLFLMRKYDSFFYLYIIFLSLSFEFSDVSNEPVYGFKTFEVFGFSICFFLLLPLFLVSIKSIKYKKDRSVSVFFRDVSIIGIAGILNGAISIFINDNNMNQLNGLWSLFVGAAVYKFVIIIIFTCIFMYLKNKYYEMAACLSSVVEYVLVGAVVTLIASFLFSVTGYYGGVSVLRVQYVSRYIPFLYILTITKTSFNEKLFYFIISTIGTYFTLAYNATGKMIIMYALMPFVIIAVTIRKNKLLGFIELGVATCFIIIVVNSILYNSYEPLGGVLFSSKLNEVKSIFSFGPNWLNNMSVSPKARIGELLNIVEEYKLHPLRVFFGKGFAGTIKDHLGVITNVLGAYSAEQNSLGIFYGMHESINNLFLSSGLLGIIFLIKYIKKLCRGLLYSPNNYIALFWLIFSFGHSLTLTVLGVVALLLSLDADDDRANLKLIKSHV